MAAETPRVRPASLGRGSDFDEARAGQVPLQGGVTLMVGEREISSVVGYVLIGRASDCQLRLEDPLISRRHARVRVSADNVTIEDLQSANGVYVNGTRIHRPRQLADGDRVLIGTNELSVFAYTAAPDGGDRPTLDVLDEPGSEPEPFATDLSSPSSSKSEATQRADAFMFVGRLADKMLALGKNAEAERIMFDHMTKVLHGARAGLPVPEDVLQGAGSYAMKLARATRRGVWIDYTVELHTLTRTTMSAPVVDAFCEAMTTVPAIDSTLFGNYLALLRSMKADLSPAELMLSSRLECLQSSPDTGDA